MSTLGLVLMSSFYLFFGCQSGRGDHEINGDEPAKGVVLESSEISLIGGLHRTSEDSDSYMLYPLGAPASNTANAVSIGVAGGQLDAVAEASLHPATVRVSGIYFEEDGLVVLDAREIVVLPADHGSTITMLGYPESPVAGQWILRPFGMGELSDGIVLNPVNSQISSDLERVRLGRDEGVYARVIGTYIEIEGSFVFNVVTLDIQSPAS